MSRGFKRLHLVHWVFVGIAIGVGMMFALDYLFVGVIRFGRAFLYLLLNLRRTYPNAIDLCLALVWVCAGVGVRYHLIRAFLLIEAEEKWSLWKRISLFVGIVVLLPAFFFDLISAGFIGEVYNINGANHANGWLFLASFVASNALAAGAVFILRTRSPANLTPSS